MIAPIAIFAVAAVGGLILAIQRFRGQPQPSLPLALAHGAAAAAGLVTLLLAVLGGSAPGGASIALGLFLVAALGGFFLFATHLRKKALPIPVVVIHAVVAVVAFAVLLFAALG